MHLQRTLPTIIAAAMVSLPVQAQQLYRLDFHGHARTLNSRGHVVTRAIGARDLIATCVGTNAFGTNRDYALAYDPNSDMVEVVSATNGSVFCQLFAFQGGMTNADGVNLDRFNFVFTPSETSAAGTAVIREKIKHGDNRISIQGQLQYVLASIAPNSGGSNSIGLLVPSTNAGTSTTTSSTNAIVSPMAVTVPAPPTLGSDPNALSTTNIAAAPAPIISSTNVDLALPGVPDSPSIATTTNATDLTNLGADSGAPPTAITPPTIPGTPTVTSPSLAVTNSLPETTAAQTNQVLVFSFTNGVIVYGNFSGGKNVLTPSTTARITR